MPTLCENCASPLEGGFCSQCGQSDTDYNIPVTQFAKEFASEAFSLDSRLRLTMKPLFFKPGAVPRDYVAGHRARFVPPIRLFLFASFAMFVSLTLGSGTRADNVTFNGVDVAAVAPDSVSPPPGSNPGGEDADPGETSFERTMQDRFVQGMQRVAEDRRAFASDFFDRFAQAMFFLLPVFAALLKLVHFRRLYVQHLVFSVYVHSFVFLVVALVALPDALPDALHLGGLSQWLPIALLGIPLYLLLAMKRFYEDRWLKTLVKFVFVWVTYSFTLAMTGLAVLVVSLLDM